MNIEITYNVITTNKIQESTEFYTNLFNYEIIADIGWYKQLKHPNGPELALMEPNHPTQPALFQPEWDGTGLIISLQVKDVDEAYKLIKDQNISIAFEMTTEDWGQKHFGIVDPNGIPIDVVQHV